MRDLRQVLVGIAVALVSLGLVLGGFSLSLAEGNMLAPTLALPSTATPTWLPFTSLPVSSTPQTPSPTEVPPTTTNCPPPAGWGAYFVQPGDTLESLANTYLTSTAEIMQANCLQTPGLVSGAVVYLPPVATQARTAIPCGRPPKWVTYTVQPGDTLYHLSQAFGVSVAELQRANCMGASITLRAGQPLFVPPGGTRTPSPTVAAPATAASSPTPTPTSTATPTNTSTPSSTATPTDTQPAPTATESPTATQSPSPTATT